MSAAKWILGGLGFVTAGPLGAVLGVLIAHMYEGAKNTQFISEGSAQREGYEAKRHQQVTAEDVRFSLLVLFSCVMKADGHVKKGELDYVKAFLVRNYGEEDAKEALQILKTLISQQVDYIAVSRQMAEVINYSTRLELVHFLFELAHADEWVDDTEIAIIEQISGALNVSAADYRSLLAMYHTENANWAYEVLEIAPGATNDEVKTAYRRMAMRYHPDKVASAGEEIQRKATEKFRKIQEAYEHIKKQRNI